MSDQYLITTIEMQHATAYREAMRLWDKAREYAEGVTDADRRALEPAIAAARLADARYWDIGRQLLIARDEALELGVERAA